MAAETLERARQHAMQLIEVDLNELEAMQQKEIHFLGHVALRGEQHAAYRAFTGPDGLIGKGGDRYAKYPTEARAIGMVSELSEEMDYKLALRGHHLLFRGAKGLVNIDVWSLTPEEK